MVIRLFKKAVATLAAFSLLVADLAWAAGPVADPSAPIGFRPTVEAAPNGVPTINIVNPSAGGVSHNKYTSFDVDPQGAVLNNSMAAGTSVLAGALIKNPNLTFPALVILNEVTGNSASQLTGPTEVFGTAASVIIANPNGISVDGGSFINAPRVTLTTGTPTTGGAGAFDGLVFSVQGGLVAVGGAGLDGAGIDQVDLVARRVEVDSAISGAGSLTVIGGGAEYAYGTGDAVAAAAPAQAGTYAIDATALGAMNAGQVKLIGTEAGLGVRALGGVAASAGDIVLTSSGEIVLSGATASGDIALSGTNLGVGGTVAATNLTASASGTLSYSGATTLSGGDLSLSGAGVTTTGTITTDQGVVVTSTAGATLAAATSARDLTGSAVEALALAGTTSLSGEASLTGGSVSTAGILSADGNVAITAGTDSALGGSISTRGDLSLNAGNGLTITGNVAADGAATAGAASIAVGSDGALSAGGAVGLAASGTVSNDGVLDAGAGLMLNASSLGNTGMIGAAETLAITTIGEVDNRVGRMAGEDIAITAGTALANATGTITGTDSVTVTAASVDNAQGFLRSTGGAVTVTTTGILDNTQGAIGGTGITLSAGSLDNSGGEIIGTGDLAVTTITGALVNKGGTLFGNGTGTLVSAAGIDNTAQGLVGSIGALSVGAQGAIDNSGGTMVTNGGATLSTPGQIIQGGSLTAFGDVDASAGTFTNRGYTASASTLAVTAGAIVNESGQMVANDGVALTATGLVDNRAQIGSGLDVSVVAGSVTNSATGRIEANRDLAMAATGAIANAGIVAANDGLSLSAGTALTNTKGTMMSGGAMVLEAGTNLINEAGLIQSGTDMAVLAGARIENRRGPVSGSTQQSESTGPATLSAGGTMLLQAPLVRNEASLLSAGGDLIITADTFENLVHSLLWRTTTSWQTCTTRFFKKRCSTHYAYSDSYSQTPSLVYAGGTLSLNAATVTNTGTIQAHKLDAVAGILTNGIVDWTIKTMPAAMPSARIDLTRYASLPQSTPGLFDISRDPASRYVVTTSVDVANLVDPYQLNARLGEAAAASPRFFADPFAEAAMLSRAALAETGRRFFVPEATTDDEQRRILYDNAAAFAAGRTDVKLGVDFTDAQIEALSRPILWYVADGDGVLVPTIYLPQVARQNLAHLEGGRIIADEADIRVAGQFTNTGFVNVANTLTIDAGSIVNERRTARVTEFVTTKKGSVFGSKTTVTAVDTNVLQQGGEITGGTVNLRADGDFTNKGGQIATAGDLAIWAGGDILNEAQKTTSVVSWNVGFWGRLLGGGGQNWDLATGFTAAELLAGGTLTAEAGGTLYNHASLIAAIGDVSLTADRIEQDWQTAVWTASRKRGLLKSSTTMGTAVATGQVNSAEGTVSMTARAEDVFSRGSGISAGEDVQLTAARDVRLESASLSVENKSSQWGLSGFGLAGSSTKWNEVVTEAATVGAGRDVVITAGRDVVGIGAQIGAGNDLTITAGRDVVFDQHQVDRYIEQKGWSAALSFFGSKALEAAMAGGDGGAIGMALLGENALLSRLYALSQSRDGWDVAANATYSGIEAINTLDKLAGLYTANGADLGQTLTDYGTDQVASKGISLRIGGWTSSDRWTETVRSSLAAASDISISAGQDVKLAGGTAVFAGDDVTLTAGRDLTLEAGADSMSSKSSGGGLTVGVSLGSETGINVGIDANKAKAEGTTYTNTQVVAGGDVVTSSGNDTRLIGANIAGDTVTMTVGGDLELVSLQNERTAQSRAGSLGVSIGSGIGGSVSLAQSDADRAFTDTPTSIIAEGELSIRTENNTNIVGAQIASKTGDLTLDTGTLTFSDLADRDTRSSSSVSMSFSPGAAIPGSGEFSRETADKEGITRATIGAGTIIIRSDPDAGLEGLNRDLARAQEILRETETKVRIVIPIPGERTGQALSGIADAIDTFVKNAISSGVPADRFAEFLATLPPEVWETLRDKAAQGHVATMTAAEREAAEKNLAQLAQGGLIPADEGERADMSAMLRKQISENPDRKPTAQQIATRDQLLANNGTGPNLDKAFWASEAGRAGQLATAIVDVLPSNTALQAAAANWNSLSASDRNDAILMVADVVAGAYGLNSPTITMVAQADFVAQFGAGTDMVAGGGSFKAGGWFTSASYVYNNGITIPDGGRVMAGSDSGINYTFANVVALIAHEVTHLYQEKMVQSYLEGRLSPSDPAYKQAKMFVANKFLYIAPTEGVDKYRAQPVEGHSYAVQDKVLELLRGAGVQ